MTLNSLIHKVLKPLAEDHLILNDFGFGDLENYAISGEVKFPLMWVVFNNAPFSDNAFTYNLSFVFADLAKEDGSDTLSIQSDLIQVAADIASKLYYIENDEVEVDTNFLLKPFTERFKDFTAGVVMDIQIKLIKSLNDCEVPLKSNI